MIESGAINLIVSIVVGFLFSLPLMASVVIIYEKVRGIN